MTDPVFTDDDLAALRALGTPRRYAAGERLFAEGEQSDYVVLIERGNVKISSVSPDGYESVLARRGPGRTIGEFAALDGLPRLGSAFAIDDVDAVLVEGHQFLRFLHDRPAATVALTLELVSRLRESTRRRVEFGAYSVEVRVARHLLELADQYGSATPDDTTTTIEVTLSHQELGGAVGASRDATARALRKLQRFGTISRDRGRVTILQPDLLRKIGGLPDRRPDATGA